MLIILDRDGVINYDSDHYIKSPDEWCAIPGSLARIAEWKHAGHQVVVATNQSGIARNLYSDKVLQAIHQKMQQQLVEYDAELDGIYYCPHHPDDLCACRKPEPGLLLQIANDFDVDLSKALLIGDSLRDLQAAEKVACPAYLVRTGKGDRTLAAHHIANPVFDSLARVTLPEESL